MYAGIILAGIVLSGLMKSPWPLIIALAAIPVVWYSKKYGNPYTKIKAWWRGTPATPTPGAAPATKKPLPRWAKWLLWIFVGVPLTLFFLLIGYHYWDSVKEGFWEMKGIANNAASVSFVINSLEERPLQELKLESGRYKVGVRGSMYFYRCNPANPGARSGCPEGGTVCGGPKTGKILVWSNSARSNPQGDNGEIIVGPDDTIFAQPDTECPNGKVVQTTSVSIQLSRIELK